MKFHSTACKISVEIDNISYCATASAKHFTLAIYLHGKKCHGFKPGEKYSKNKNTF
jgi:hypothetical protein